MMTSGSEYGIGEKILSSDEVANLPFSQHEGYDGSYVYVMSDVQGLFYADREFSGIALKLMEISPFKRISIVPKLSKGTENKLLEAIAKQHNDFIKCQEEREVFFELVKQNC